MNRSQRNFLYLILGIALIIGTLLVWHSYDKYERSTKINRPKSEPKFRNDGTLAFLSPSGQDTITVINIEIVEKTEDIIQGMMFRSALDKLSGMLFVFTIEEEHIFWMQNTKISLDILFVNRNFEIVTIAGHRVPYSTDPIPSGIPIQYVVEVNAGFCDEYRISAGHLIKYKSE